MKGARPGGGGGISVIKKGSGLKTKEGSTIKTSTIQGRKSV